MIDKFDKAIKNSNFFKLPKDEQKLLKDFANFYKLSFQEIRILIEIANDLNIWDEGSISKYLKLLNHDINDLKQEKKRVINSIKKRYEEIKTKPKNYKDFDSKKAINQEV